MTLGRGSLIKFFVIKCHSCKDKRETGIPAGTTKHRISSIGEKTGKSSRKCGVF